MRRVTPGRRGVACVLVLMLGIVPGSAVAQDEVEPSHVFQVVEGINRYLTAFHTANLSQDADASSVFEARDRRPRHVLQKAREVLDKAYTLQSLLGQDPGDMPPMPAREVQPADVKQTVDRLHHCVASLAPEFGLAEEPEAPALQTGKTPSDVYRHLVRADRRLQALGVPAQVPNDVYALATAIRAEIQRIHAVRGVDLAYEEVADDDNKRPAEVYGAAYEALRSLKRLADTREGYAIPGGVVLPERIEGQVDPGDVLKMMNMLLAEAASMKVAVGGEKPARIPQDVAGKTPRDVYNVIATVGNMIDSLRNT